MRVDLQPGYVLHSRPFRDTSLIVDCFTRDYGRVSLLARGARSAKQKQKPFIQAFTPILFSWQGKTSLKTLLGSEPASQLTILTGLSLYTGFYLNELLVRVLPELDAHDELWEQYSQCLYRLQHVKADIKAVTIEPLLRVFELTLLDQLGYGIDLRFDLNGVPIREDTYYQLVDVQGFLPAEEGYSGAWLTAMARYEFTASDVRAAAKRLLRVLLKPHLGSKPLQSRQLFSKF